MERLIEMCKAIWPMLTEEEQEVYAYDTGLIGFIEIMADMLHFDANSLSEDEIDKILKYLY